MSSAAAVILAAGQGTRMKSELPKVLHTIDERPMACYVVETVRAAGLERAIVVVGHRAELVREALAGAEGLEFVTQTEQLGTGHAVIQCERALSGFDGTVVVLSGDVPGLRVGTLKDFLGYHRERAASATVMTARLPDPTGYGRVIRGDDDSLLRIVEHKDAGEEERRIDEVNAGLYCFERAPLFGALKQTDRANAQNEYYLTDVVGRMNAEGLTVAAWCVPDAREVAGVNTPAELDAVREFMRDGGR
jgi:bifunctional UDP-N-acetylglucosamine pyrophosphorylase/glucosamine-1-phosphate N-acetyltransferase